MLKDIDEKIAKAFEAIDKEDHKNEQEDILCIMDAIMDAMSATINAKRQNQITARVLRSLALSLALAASYLDDICDGDILSDDDDEDEIGED